MPAGWRLTPARDLRQRLIDLGGAHRASDRDGDDPALCSSPYWQWLSLTLAAPVVVWGGWPFHKAAWTNLRHGTSTMDTLVSLGTLAAFGWSVYALFWGSAGEPGMTHPFELTIERMSGDGNIYFEAAAGVTTFLLAGRYFEARSKRQAGAALRALLEHGRTRGCRAARRCRGPDPDRELAVGDVSSCGRGRRSRLTGSSRRAPRRSTRRCSPGSRCRSRSVSATRSSARPSTPAVGSSCGRPAIGADTQLAQMARLVEDAQNGKASAQRLADRISGFFVPVVIALSVATLGFWLGTGAGRRLPSLPRWRC